MSIGDNATISGMTGFTYEFYNLKNKNGGFKAPIQPKHDFIFRSFNEIRVGEDFSMPVRLMFSNRMTNFLIPYPATQNFVQFFLNPRNIAYVAPTYKGHTLHLGTYIPHQSELTVSHQQVVGVGYEGQISNFGIQFHYGISQQPVEMSNSFAGAAYKRLQSSFRFDYGKKDKFKFGINYAQYKDRVKSIDAMPFYPPKKATVLSIDGEFEISDKVKADFEIANSAIAGNIQATGGNPNFSLAGLFIDDDAGYLNGYAVNGGVDWKTGTAFTRFDVHFSSRDFTYVGYPFQFGNQFRIEAKPNFSLCKGKTRVSAQAGIYSNNINPVDSGRSWQAYAGFNALTRFNQNWSVQSGYYYSHFFNDLHGFAKQKQDFHQLTLAPSFRKKIGSLNHVWTVGVILGYSNDKNKLRETFSDYLSHNKYITYRLNARKWNSGAALNIVCTKLGGVKTRRYQVTLDGRLRLLEDKLQPLTALTFAFQNSGGTVTGRKFYWRFGADYEAVDNLFFHFSFYTHLFKYAKGSNAPRFTETLLRIGVNYVFK